MKMRQILLLLAAFSVANGLLYGCSKKEDAQDAPAGANTPTQAPRQRPDGKPTLSPSGAGGGTAPAPATGKTSPQ